jgi:hypothetical protein
MNFQEWRAEAEWLLRMLRPSEFGCPLGENLVRPPDLSTISLANQLDDVYPLCVEQLDAFFRVSDGLSWPDVRNGYFIKHRDEIGRIPDEYDPTMIDGHIGGSIIVVGSSGGGALFTVRKTIGDIVLLPNGRIEKNTYYDSDGNARVVASDFHAFAGLLLDDLRAFVTNDEGHIYVV